MIDENEIRKLARLAHLKLEETEIGELSKDLNSILEYVKTLEKVDVKNVEPMSHVHGSINIFRDDIAEPSMPIEKSLSNAPDTSGRFIRVPIIIEQSGES